MEKSKYSNPLGACRLQIEAATAPCRIVLTGFVVFFFLDSLIAIPPMISGYLITAHLPRKRIVVQIAVVEEFSVRDSREPFGIRIYSSCLSSVSGACE